MASKRKFYKTIITVEVLSEEPYSETDLETVSDDITNGHCSGVVNIKSSKILTEKQAAEALKNQGSDTEFFQLDDAGNDLEDGEDDDN